MMDLSDEELELLRKAYSAAWGAPIGPETTREFAAYGISPWELDRRFVQYWTAVLDGDPGFPIVDAP